MRVKRSQTTIQQRLKIISAAASAKIFNCYCRLCATTYTPIISVENIFLPISCTMQVDNRSYTFDLSISKKMGIEQCLSVWKCTQKCPKKIIFWKQISQISRSLRSPKDGRTDGSTSGLLSVHFRSTSVHKICSRTNRKNDF